MNAQIDPKLKSKWDKNLETFKMYAVAVKEQARYVETLVTKLQSMHDDYILLLIDVAKSGRNDLTRHFSVCYFKTLLIVFDQIMLLQTGRMVRTYLKVEKQYVTERKVNYFNYDYAESRKSVKLSILSRDGYIFEGKVFMSELNKDCNMFKVQVYFVSHAIESQLHLFSSIYFRLIPQRRKQHTSFPTSCVTITKPAECKLLNPVGLKNLR